MLQPFVHVEVRVLMRTRSFPIGVLVLSLMCGGQGGCSEAVDEERTAAACSDGRDNDRDGIIDCDDPDCRSVSACQGETGQDGGAGDGALLPADGGSTPDAAHVADLAPDGPAPRPEVEPNDGATAEEVNAVAIPDVITGAIGSPGDVDLFRWTAQAGDRLVVTVTAHEELQAHLAIFGDAPLEVPPAVSSGPGPDAMAELYALKSGVYYIAVRDRRNVGERSGQVGGPDFGYTLSILPLTRPPIPVTVGQEVAAEMLPHGVIRVFAFEAVEGDNLSITVLADRLQPPSDVDSRVSLFFPAQGIWLGTNEDLSASQTDSLLEGEMPFTGAYHVVVEDVGEGGEDMRIVLRIADQV